MITPKDLLRSAINDHEGLKETLEMFCATELFLDLAVEDRPEEAVGALAEIITRKELKVGQIIAVAFKWKERKFWANVRRYAAITYDKVKELELEDVICSMGRVPSLVPILKRAGILDEFAKNVLVVVQKGETDLDVVFKPGKKLLDVFNEAFDFADTPEGLDFWKRKVGKCFLLAPYTSTLK